MPRLSRKANYFLAAGLLVMGMLAPLIDNFYLMVLVGGLGWGGAAGMVVSVNGARMETKSVTNDTPAIGVVAATFFVCIGYFVVEHYFTAKEYFAEAPPYFAIALCAIAGAAIVFFVLRWLEPGGANHTALAALSALAFGLAVYAFIPRLNFMTDQGDLVEYVYQLDQENVWQPQDSSAPPLRLYLKSSAWWQQYQPGDTYTFELRRGGLGIWQVNMARIYEEQKRYYNCGGVVSCITK